MTRIQLLLDMDELGSVFDVTQQVKRGGVVICVDPHGPRMRLASALRMLDSLSVELPLSLILLDALEQRSRKREEAGIIALIRKVDVIELPTISLMKPEREQRSFGPVYQLPNSSRHKAKMQRQPPRHKRY